MVFPTIPSPPTLFQTYLVPSLPFRRRQSSTDSAASSSSSDTTDSSYGPSNLPHPAGQGSDSYLSGRASHLRCARCFSDLALSSQIISKGFTGRHGRAYLVAPSQSSISSNPMNLHTAKAKSDALPNLPNTFTLKPVPRQLVTGAHTVGDISCAQCGSILGWKYVAADEEAQRYKVGKFILETKRVCRSSTWESEDAMVDDYEHAAQSRRTSDARKRSSLLPPPPNEIAANANAEHEVEFDSQDEEECEDLFLGVWTPQLAAKKRRLKAFNKIDEM